VAVLAVVATALAPVGAAAAEGDSLEYAVKAAYLYKLGDYVEWPASAFETPTSAVSICVAGEDPFGSTLDTSVAGQRIAGHPIAIRRLRVVDRNSGCRILYVGGTDQQRIAQALDAVRGTPVVTVTDSARGADAGGIIHFVVKDNRVRFTIDDQAASLNGLTISSKLFSLALSVRPRN
jgi:hypothetical protein